MRLNKQKYWYYWYLGSCPLCGKDYSYKIRQYRIKPNDPKLRYEDLSPFYTYDWCDIDYA